MVKARSKKAKFGSHPKAKKAPPMGKRKPQGKSKKPAPKPPARRTVKNSAKAAPKTSAKLFRKRVLAPRAAKTASKTAPKKTGKRGSPVPAPTPAPPATPPVPVIPLPGASAQPVPLPPAVDRALAQAEVEGLISRLPLPVQLIVRTLRALVLEAAPEASEVLEDGTPAYFVNGIFARIVPSEREVLVKFLKGGHLDSAPQLAGEGETRSVSVSSLDEIKENVLRKLVREAVMLNLSSSPTLRA